MWERLRRFSSLDPAARELFLRALLLLPLISFRLRFRGFGATQQTLQGFLGDSVKNAMKDSTVLANDLQRATLTARMVNAAARYAWKNATCLEKSLALWYLLARQGIATGVRIGARKAGGKFEAHAWVECNGVALNEPGDEHRHYATFDAAFPLQSSESS